MAQSHSYRWWWRFWKTRSSPIIAKSRRSWNTVVAPSKSDIFWPSIFMLLPLVLGVVLALGHHLFFSHLSGRAVPDTNFINSTSVQLSTQQANLAIGNAFAFLVKACLNVAVGIAYVQLFWATIYQKPQTVSAVDTMFSSLSNLFMLGRGKVWWRHPLLLILSLTVWLNPLQSIFTPATLTVRTAKVSPTQSQMVHVPRVDFTSTNFAKSRGFGAYWVDDWDYTGFSDTVKGVVTSTCMLGTINSFTTPAPNASWSVDFYGPSLSCSPVDTSVQLEIRDNIWTAFNMFYERTDQVDVRDLYDGFYLSWTPRVDQLPYHFSSNVQATTYPNLTGQFYQIHNRTYNYTVESRSLGPLLGALSTDDSSFEDYKPAEEISMPATLYFALVPGIEPPGMENMTVTQCKLGNSSYSVSFNFVNGIQELNLHVSTPNNNIFAYHNTNFSSDNGLVNATGVENLAYQTIMDAFGSMFVGLEYAETSVSEDLKDPGMVPNSSVMSSVIGARANELKFMRPVEVDYVGWLGKSITEDMSDRFNLQDGLEELFKNVTVNLMTSYRLQPNYSSPYAPPPTNVTFTTYHNVYNYSASKLWIAYGISVSFSTICVLAGLATLVSSRAYYSADFSTVLRASKASHLSVDFDSADTDGKYPLPKYISDAKIAFGGTKGRDATVYSQVKEVGHRSDAEAESGTATNGASSGRSVSFTEQQDITLRLHDQ